MRLYKLKSLEGDGLFHVLDMIVNERIYLSTCDPMNDVDESSWGYAEPPDANYIETAEELRKIVDAQRFTCFIDSIDNPLMWAHYAGGFRGVALEYYFEGSHDIRHIDYCGKPLISKSQMEAVIGGTSKPQDIGILKQKAPAWSYENEWRLYGARDDKYIENVKPQSVIFGVKNSRYTVLREIVRRWDIGVGYLQQEAESSEYSVHYVHYA